MDFKQFLLVLRRRWRSIVGILLLALLIAGSISFALTPQYESRSKVFLSVDVRDTTDAYAASLFASNRASSYADLARSSELTGRVVEVLNLDMTAEDLAEKVDAEVLETTSLIEIVVTDEDPRRAQKIADVTVEQFATYIAELETPGGESSQNSQITAQVTDRATYDPDPVFPRTWLNLVVAGIVGLLLGVALAVSRELLDRTIRTADHVADVTDAPVLASIGFDNQMRSAPLITDLDGFAARTEAFRLLRTNLQYIDLDQHPHCLVVTSSVPGEGKTTTATNLAVALAQTGRKVLIVDADLRKPRVASTLGLDPATGLTTALLGRVEPQEAIQVHEPSGLHVLASGAKPPNPTEILQSRVTSDLLARLRSSYDMIIIDAPPLLPVADAAVLSRLADGVLLVVRHGKTTKDQVEESITRLRQVGGRLYGVVVNMVARRAISSYYYYYEETGKYSGRSSTATAQKTAKGQKPATGQQPPKPRGRRAKASSESPTEVTTDRAAGGGTGS